MPQGQRGGRYGIPCDKRQERQKVGIKPQYQIARKAQSSSPTNLNPPPKTLEAKNRSGTLNKVEEPSKFF